MNTKSQSRPVLEPRPAAQVRLRIGISVPLISIVFLLFLIGMHVILAPFDLLKYTGYTGWGYLLPDLIGLFSLVLGLIIFASLDVPVRPGWLISRGAAFM